MVSTTKSRGGRPQAVHHPKNGGPPVVGLMPLKDGRWRVSGSEKFTFTEPDEARAIARCLEYQTARSGKSTRVLVPLVKTTDATHAVRQMVRAKGKAFVSRISTDGTITVQHTFDTAEAWLWFSEQILTRPQYVAQRTGIEQLGYLRDLKQPTESPTLDQVGQVYLDHAKITDRERALSKRWWAEFSRSIGVKTLREVTTDLVVKYHDKIMASDLGAVAIGHKFGKTKTVINFARKRGLDVADCRNAIDACAVLVPPQKTSADPMPISRDDFHAMLKAAKSMPKMYAAILLALNGAFYAAELCDLTWGDVQGDVICTTRNKSAHVSKQPVRRAAVLWTETVKALNKIKPDDADKHARVFNLVAGTVREFWQDLRTKAGVSTDVKFNHIRDGAYTAAVEGDGVEFQHAQVLAGHRCGMSDKYVARRPRMVERACAAIHKAYFVK